MIDIYLQEQLIYLSEQLNRDNWYDWTALLIYTLLFLDHGLPWVYEEQGSF